MVTTDFGAASAALPGWALYPATLVLSLLFLFVLFRQRRLIVKMALFIPWIRYLASFYHQYTFVPLAAGLSGNALISSSVFLVGILLVKQKHLLMKLLLPCYLIMMVIGLSGLANHRFGGTIDAVVKFGYLIVVSLSVFEALVAVGEPRLSKLLLWPFVMPLAFQMLSLGLGVQKAGENDGSVSY